MIMYFVMLAGTQREGIKVSFSLFKELLGKSMYRFWLWLFLLIIGILFVILPEMILSFTLFGLNYILLRGIGVILIFVFWDIRNGEV